MVKAAQLFEYRLHTKNCKANIKTWRIQTQNWNDKIIKHNEYRFPWRDEAGNAREVGGEHQGLRR